jgi:hypothetical protein
MRTSILQVVNAASTKLSAQDIYFVAGFKQAALQTLT